MALGIDRTNRKKGNSTQDRKTQDFEGIKDSLSLSLLSKVPDTFKSVSKYEYKKDTLNFWFTPFETDSLNFIVTNKDYIDTVTVKLRKKQIDEMGNLVEHQDYLVRIPNGYTCHFERFNER